MEDPQQAMFRVEALASRLYNSPNAEERTAAEHELMHISNAPECIPQCQYVLEHSAVPYAQLVMANALRKLVTQNWNNSTAQQRLDMRTWVLSYLANTGPKVAPFVSSSLVQLLCRITKMGWFEDPSHQKITEEVSQFLHATPKHCVIGLGILTQLVSEMNLPAAGRSLTQHRKTASSFRDLALLQIFQVSISTLRSLQGGSISSGGPEALKLQELALQLALLCLSYDFIGTTLDEASEELGTIQVPTSWRGLMEDATTMQLFWDTYSSSQPPHSSTALECLVQLASLRRSLFSSEAQRGLFLNRLLGGVLKVLQTQAGLRQHENYHELCRLLARVKANYQLGELVVADHYEEWIELVAAFTIDSFQHWQWASNSVYYLLSLWSRLVASIPYLKGEASSNLEKYVPQVTRAFILSRIECIRSALSALDTADDPLGDEEQLTEQLESLPSLCRFQLTQASEYIVGLFDPVAQMYQQLLALPQAERLAVRETQLRLSQCEAELAWLVYTVGAILGSHLTPASSPETQQLIDGELSGRVFQLAILTDSQLSATERLNVRSNQQLELSILYFFGQFRKVYIGDQATSSSKVYQYLSERLMLNDHLAVLMLLMQKVTGHLKFRHECAELTGKALALFSELAAGYSSGKLLLKLDIVHQILRSHTAVEFPFLDVPANGRHRTSFQGMLARLLFSESEQPSQFSQFMLPIKGALDKLCEAAQQGSDVFGSEASERLLIGARGAAGRGPAPRPEPGLSEGWASLALPAALAPSRQLPHALSRWLGCCAPGAPRDRARGAAAARAGGRTAWPAPRRSQGPGCGRELGWERGEGAVLLGARARTAEARLATDSSLSRLRNAARPTPRPPPPPQSAQALCATSAGSARRAATGGRTGSSSTSSTRPTRRCCARWRCSGTTRPQ
jgi:exportin-7